MGRVPWLLWVVFGMGGWMTGAGDTVASALAPRRGGVSREVVVSNGSFVSVLV